MDALTELRKIIAYELNLDIALENQLERIAIKAFKLGANAGRLAEKAETNNKIAKLGGN